MIISGHVVGVLYRETLNPILSKCDFAIKSRKQILKWTINRKHCIILHKKQTTFTWTSSINQSQNSYQTK